jgi:membrane fusion protein (multidrug efflux system)
MDQLQWPPFRQSMALPMPSMTMRRAAALLTSAVLLAALAACGPGGAQAPGGPGGGAPPPPQVGVVTVQLKPVALSTELPGRLEARRTAQVRARVAGIVQRRLFEEGAVVRAGQVLFTLDADSYRAAVASAQANAARAQAALAQAQTQVERNRPLAEARAISQQEWLATETQLKSAQAEVAAGKAAIDATRVTLGYATITAPIAGRIGRAEVSEGALVGPADPTPMAVIQQTNPLYVNFTQSAADAMRLRRAVDAGQLKRIGTDAVEVRLVLDDGSVYPQPAKLLFADPTVDPATGQVSLRAEVPNGEGRLLPGLYVKVRLAQAVSEQALRLPQQAVTRDASGDTVLVVGADNKPAPRKVKVAGAMGGDWVVVEGLANGERVIVDGFQKMFVPGAPVTPVPWSPPGASAPASSAPASSAPAAAASGASR